MAMAQLKKFQKWLRENREEGLSGLIDQGLQEQIDDDTINLPVGTAGRVTLLDYMGDDLTVVNAARVSFSKESDEINEKDKKLIGFLAKHEHWTPFGQPVLQFRMKMPIFVARQFMRSNVGIVYNEESRRYISSDPQFYYPKMWRKKPDTNIKQGSGKNFSEEESKKYNHSLKVLVEYAVELYEKMLLDGVAPELARMVLPVNMYTEFVCSMTLAATIRVVDLRVDEHAQYEVRQFAEAIKEIAEVLFPVSMSAHFGVP